MAVQLPAESARGDEVTVGPDMGRAMGSSAGPTTGPTAGPRDRRLLVGLVAAGVMILGLVQKYPCIDGWSGPLTKDCYSDVVALWFAERLSEGAVPYLDYPVEYPVLLGLLMHLTATGVRALHPVNAPAAFFMLNWLILAASGVVAALATASVMGPGRRTHMALLAVVPAVALAAFINWDLLAVALVAVSMLLWARGRVGWSGVFIGLAVATKFYPVVIVGAMLVPCLRAGMVRTWLRYLATALLAWLVVNVPVALAAPQLPHRDGSPGTVNGWWEFYRFSSIRGADWGSVWYWWQSTFGALGGPGGASGRLNLLSAAAFLLLILGIVALGLAAPRRPRVGQVAFLALAAFVLTSKVYSPQYVLWLAPLAVLALPRWRPLLIWQAAEVAYFLAIWRYLQGVGTPGAGISSGVYFLALGARFVTVCLLCALVVRDVIRPSYDVVRSDGTDDPAGGPLSGAADSLSVAHGGILRP